MRKTLGNQRSCLQFQLALQSWRNNSRLLGTILQRLGGAVLPVEMTNLASWSKSFVSTYHCHRWSSWNQRWLPDCRQLLECSCSFQILPGYVSIMLKLEVKRGKEQKLEETTMQNQTLQDSTKQDQTNDDWDLASKQIGCPVALQIVPGFDVRTQFWRISRSSWRTWLLIRVKPRRCSVLTAVLSQWSLHSWLNLEVAKAIPSRELTYPTLAKPEKIMDSKNDSDRRGCWDSFPAGYGYMRHLSKQLSIASARVAELEDELQMMKTNSAKAGMQGWVVY